MAEFIALLSKFVPLGLVIIMFGMGLSLTINDFKRVFVFPKASLGGLAGQMLLLPVIGFTTVDIFNLTGEIAVGVIVLVTCAGGATSNLFSFLARADTALSVTLTAASSVLIVITLPIIVNMALGTYLNTEAELSLPVWNTIKTLSMMTIVPVIVGMALAAKYPSHVSLLEPWIRKLSLLVLGLIVFPTLVNAPNTVQGHLGSLVPAMFFLNLISMIAGYAIARALKLNQAQSRTLTIEVGVQNVVTGFFVATTLLHNAQLAVPAAIYAIPMVLNVVLYILWGRFQHNQSSTQ
jgi:BASS family bile acid:Na+ symporter